MLYIEEGQRPPQWAVELHNLLGQYKIEAILMVFDPNNAALFLTHHTLDILSLGQEYEINQQDRVPDLEGIIAIVDKLK